MSFEWKGVFPALTSKFTVDDELDLPLFNKNLQKQLAAGVEGIILGGTLGEASVLTTEEKEVLVKFAIEKVNRKVPVIINIAEISSAYPRNAGSSYYWAGQLCPKLYSPIVSYWTGVFVIIAYSGYAASYAYGFAILLDSAISLTIGGYDVLSDIEQGGIAIAILAVWCVLSSLRIDYKDWVSHISAFLQLSVALAIIIVISIMSKKRNNPKYVFLYYETNSINDHSFPQISFILAVCVISQFYPLVEFSSDDGALNIFEAGEQTIHSKITPSTSLVATGLITGLFGLGLLISLLFSVSSKEKETKAENGVLEVILEAGGIEVTIFFAWYIVITAFFAGFSFVPVGINLVFTLAKDNFFPYSTTIFAKLNDNHYPFYSMLLFFIMTIFIFILDMIENADGANDTDVQHMAFTSVLQTSNFAFQLSFGIPILLKITYISQMAQKSIEKAYFYLGPVWSIILGWIAIIWLFSTAILLLLPTLYPLTVLNMNYTIIVISVLVLFGFINWECHCINSKFKGPKRLDDDVNYHFYTSLSTSSERLV